jgi:hypothetical protein
MNPLPMRLGWSPCRLLLLGLLLGTPSVWSQEVEVTAVNFTNVRAPLGINTNWLEAEVGLNVKPAAGTPGQMVSRVKVILLVGFDLPPPVAGGQRRLEHYRAEAECVALEPGRTDVRFYLPPELVKRDQLHADPKYWGVELAVAGRSVPASRAAYSLALGSAEQRKNFQTRGTAAAAANDGILLPQYLTPFANDNRRGTIPSFVRKEVR